MQYAVFRTHYMFNRLTVIRQLPKTNACTALFVCESPKEITFPDKNGSKDSMAATRQGVLFYALESREDCFIFQAVFFPREASAVQIYYLSHRFVSDVPLFCYF